MARLSVWNDLLCLFVLPLVSCRCLVQTLGSSRLCRKGRIPELVSACDCARKQEPTYLFDHLMLVFAVWASVLYVCTSLRDGQRLLGRSLRAGLERLAS